MWLLSENGSILYEPLHSPLQGTKVRIKKTVSARKFPANTAMINPEKKGMHKRMGCKADGEDFIKTSNAADRPLGAPPLIQPCR